MESPSPAPGGPWKLARGPWVKGWHRVSSRVPGMPAPLSEIVHSSRSEPSRRCRAARVTRTPPRRVNLMALPMRLNSTCRILAASPSSISGRPSSRRQARERPFFSAATRKRSSMAATSSRGAKGAAATDSLPDSTRERSRMSLSSCVRRPEAVTAMARRRCCSGDRGVSSRVCSMPRMPFRGVRISWLMLARNSLLVRLAASAFSRAATSSASFFFWAVTSCMMPKIFLSTGS